jgi:uncharacterized protein YcnI
MSKTTFNAQTAVLARFAVGFAAATLLGLGLALAHATVRTEMGLSESKASAREVYRLRVPTEKPLSTIEVRMIVPAGLVISGFEVQPGFTRTAVKNDKGLITEVTWRGRIGADEYGLFPFRATNPAQAGNLCFKVYQKYSDGSVVAWDQLEDKAEKPASCVVIKAN